MVSFDIEFEKIRNNAIGNLKKDYDFVKSVENYHINRFVKIIDDKDFVVLRLKPLEKNNE